MCDNIWLLITIFFISSVILIFLIVYSLGYRIIKKEQLKPNVDHDASKIKELSDFVYQQLLLNEAMIALSSIDEGVIVTDKNNQILYINDAALKIIGVKPDKWQGHTFIEVIMDHECDAVLKKCIDTGAMQYSYLKTHRQKEFWHITALPVQNKSNNIVIIKDFTERQRMEEIRKDLVSNIAHEFRTPIASIKLLTETLIEGAMQDPNVSTDFLRKIDIESSKLQSMTDGLSKLSTMDRGGLILDKTEIDISNLIKQAVDRISTQASRKGIIIDIKVGPGIPNPVADREGVESVLINLLHNAVKYTGQEGHIDIVAVKEGNEIVVKVADNGIGIPAEDVPHVFERFYKVDKSRSGEGFGLGLAIAKHVIESNGGKLWVESVEGKGSTFYFSLRLK